MLREWLPGQAARARAQVGTGSLLPTGPRHSRQQQKPHFARISDSKMFLSYVVLKSGCVVKTSYLPENFRLQQDKHQPFTRKKGKEAEGERWMA